VQWLWFNSSRYRLDCEQEPVAAAVEPTDHHGGRKTEIFEDFQKWADELVDVLTEAIHLCDLYPKRVVDETFLIADTGCESRSQRC
jgi:hypothetical protein